MNIEFLRTIAELTLVERRELIEEWPKGTLFCTISPNPNKKHICTKTSNGRRINVKIPYGKLPQRVQYDYCIKILKQCYNNSTLTKIYGSWELNKEGNVHFHFLMYDPGIKTNTTLKIFQRDVLNCEVTLDNMTKKGNMVDWMNNIVFVNDSIRERIDYMHKDLEQMSEALIFPYYYGSFMKIPDTKIADRA